MRVRRAGAAVCVLAAVFVSGCFQSSTLTKMKPDGSGSIEQTITMNADALAQLSAMAAMGDSKDKKSPDKDIFSDADARAAASKMGQGVTFVSAQKIDTPDHKGLKAIYAFTDIRKISLEEMSAPSGLSSDAPGGPSAKDPPLTFKFNQLPGGHSVLGIVQPGVEKAMTSTSTSPAPKPDQADPKMAAQGMEMMKAFLKGLKVDLAVQVDHLVKTNSTYVDGGTVTILSMDFDKVLADPKALERMNNAKTLADSKQLLKDVKGIKINVQPEVTIEFSGK